MTANQVVLAWSLMSGQGARRLCESVVVTRGSRSRMWGGLWLMYVFSFTIWSIY